MNWTLDLADQNSYQFKQLAGMLEEGINDVLRAQFQNFAFQTTVQKFSEGSVIVEFDITVTSKDDDKEDSIWKTEIAEALISSINQDYGFLFGKFSTANNSQKNTREMYCQDTCGTSSCRLEGSLPPGSGARGRGGCWRTPPCSATPTQWCSMGSA